MKKPEDLTSDILDRIRDGKAGNEELLQVINGSLLRIRRSTLTIEWFVAICSMIWIFEKLAFYFG